VIYKYIAAYELGVIITLLYTLIPFLKFWIVRYKKEGIDSEFIMMLAIYGILFPLWIFVWFLRTTWILSVYVIKMLTPTNEEKEG
jgi:hypothetical protein